MIQQGFVAAQPGSLLIQAALTDKPEDVAPTSPKAVASAEATRSRPRPKPTMAPKLLARLQQQQRSDVEAVPLSMQREEQGYSLRSSNLVDPVEASIREKRRQAPRLQYYLPGQVWVWSSRLAWVVSSFASTLGARATGH